ncbi:methylaspartate ammonia-lyase [Planotetraspora kaengkrachanensis]|uniref:methylaspartate ammonia-lyase n=1 Tax=Planotetraspora kaengkrachanensis TaxID=575193 RepID=A0A8J3PY55_9ACTN|nr:methylaspartate ammonia-lyase [Planotetraspora kaengkrachanensis]GIG83046.1 methylaspartate ammonia-lyase [Planotetraspora kaengkrachanensis]
MRIAKVLTRPIRTGFFADDQAAIRAGAEHDGFAYRGDPITPGFSAIRQAGEALSVLLLLEDGSVAHGDCAAVQYSGAGGRDPLFDAAAARRDVEEHLVPLLVGAELDSFRELAGRVDTLRTATGPLHTAVRYGVTQAVLDAVAQSRRLTMAEVVRDEYATGVELRPVPMFAQTGDDRYANAEKMILKQVDVLPHALINNVDTKLGRQGELLEDYLRWLVSRIGELRPDGAYTPRLHFDTYGTVGLAFDGDVEAVAAYLARLGDVAAPYELVVEHPIDAGGRDEQIETYVLLRAALRRRGAQVKVAVDEWCNTLEDIEMFVDKEAADVIHVKTPDLGGINNTIEALLLVRDRGLVAYCGGTCNETDRSAQVSANVAMACAAGQVLAKPGMGVDEGLMIVGNEMARVAALATARGEGVLP